MATPEPDSKTLATGELVWAKTKGRHHWWPARLLAAPARNQPATVACFGDGDDQPPRQATSLRRFAHSAVDKMARASAARGFLGAVELAHAAAVALLCTGLTCACAAVDPAPAPAEGAALGGVVDNMSPAEYLASLRGAAVAAPSVGLVDRARLKSWARALGQGWGPASAGSYPRRSVEELVDKIDLDDLDEPAGDADDDEDYTDKTPAQRKRRGRPRGQEDASQLAEETDAVVTNQKEDESGGGPGTELSTTGRKRKKSKYLSPPYTDLIPSVLDEKPVADLPKESAPTATEEEEEVLPPDNADAGDVLESLRSFAEGGFFHESGFPVPAERFLGLLRSKTFAGVDVAAGSVSDSGAALKLGKSVLERSRRKDEVGLAGSSVKSRKMEKTSQTATLDFPAENFVAEDGAGLVSDSAAAPKGGKGVAKRGRKKKDQDGSGGSSTPQLPAENVSADTSFAGGTGLVPHSCATAEQGTGVVKRGRKKKDQDGSGGSSIKRKRMKKTSPTAILNSGVVITPAIPIRQLRAEDLITQVRPGGMGVGVLDQNKLGFQSPIPAAMSGGMMEPGEEQNQADGGSAVKTPVTAEATTQGTHADVENVVADLAAKSVQAEQTKPGMGIQVDMNVQSGIVDVPTRSVHMEAMDLETNITVETNEQGAVADVAVRSGLVPKHGGISQLADGNTSTANVELRAAQESYASLEAMVPEMYKKVDEIPTGTNVTATNHAFKAEGQKGEQTSQKKTTGEAIANHAPAISTNGTYSVTPNSTPRRNKKAPQHFENPVEIVLLFRDGVILPSKEELLSTFSKFGILIESLSGILKDVRGARVVFGKSAEGDAVYAKRETPGIYGQFGPPFATLQTLSYLRPYTPPPALKALPGFADMKKNVKNMMPFLAGQKAAATSSAGMNHILPLPDLKASLGVAGMKKNVENMMSSLAGQKAAATSSAGMNPAPEYLFGEMQRLLSKLDMAKPGSSSSASAPQ